MSDSKGFRVNGSGHRVLKALDRGPACWGRLRHQVHGVAHNRRTRKFWFLIVAMVRDGLIADERDQFRITDRGRAALERLDQGVPLLAADSRPNIRLFVEKAA